MMPTNNSHPPVISCYLVLYYPHEVEVDLSLLVLVHPRLQYRSADGSHVQQPLNRSVIRILVRLKGRIETNADTDPAYYLNADPNLDQGIKNQCRTMRIRIVIRLCPQKVGF